MLLRYSYYDILSLNYGHLRRDMRVITIIRKNKNALLTLILLVTVTFIYGCQCEGSIGNSSQKSEKIEIVNTIVESK